MGIQSSNKKLIRHTYIKTAIMQTVSQKKHQEYFTNSYLYGLHDLLKLVIKANKDSNASII